VQSDDFAVQPVSGTCSASHHADSALTVLGCLQAMGEKCSNAVLEVLGPARALVREQHYPQRPLRFAGGRWRGYYHSHGRSLQQPREHGHFHLFTGGAGDWIHVAALGMDSDGQPLRWFATNRWVTAGPWGERGELLRAIDRLRPSGEPGLLGAWLAALLGLYRDDIDALLAQRDARLVRHQCRHPDRAALEDRSLYELASSRVQLTRRLQRTLAS
jgi:hypothetical protein